jgi:bifunctional DNase/RNase
MKLQDADPPRPLTHDLACSLVESLEGEIRRVTVTELRDNTFHASVTLVRGDREIDVDSRTSDAIALALRHGAPIFAADAVVDESGVEFQAGEAVLEQAQGALFEQGDAVDLEDVDVGEFRRFLDSVSPDEFASGLDEPS